jgi:hypothetical protein
MLNVHRVRLLVGGRAAGPDGDESRILCAVVASVMSLMILCGRAPVRGPQPQGGRRRREDLRRHQRRRGHSPAHACRLGRVASWMRAAQ